MLRFGIHYGCHLIIPILVAYFVFPKQWKKIVIIFLLTMIIDLDHLIATPIFDPNRCSIGFHPLHSYWAMCGYAILAGFPKTRILGIALLWHLITDQLDCWMMAF